jgi:hypothetical protein
LDAELTRSTELLLLRGDGRSSKHGRNNQPVRSARRKIFDSCDAPIARRAA